MSRKCLPTYALWDSDVIQFWRHSAVIQLEIPSEIQTGIGSDVSWTVWRMLFPRQRLMVAVGWPRFGRQPCESAKRPTSNWPAPVNRKRALALYVRKYGDFGPTLSAKYLVQEEGLRVSVTTLRRWLIAAQLWKPKPLRSPHRQWRERKANFGEMVQIDGSRHAWLEGRGGPM